MTNRIKGYMNGGDEDRSVALPQSCNDAFQRVSDAIDDLRLPPNVHAATRILEQLMAVRNELEKYMRARLDEKMDPYPKRDYPDTKRRYNGETDEWEQVPKRGRPGNDPIHQSEYKITGRMHSIVSELEKIKHPRELQDEYEFAIRQFRRLADELTDLGLYLDQGRTYANKRTMPDPDDEDFKASQPTGRKALFSRLNDLGPGHKTR